MKPAENSNRTFKCPFAVQKIDIQSECIEGRSDLAEFTIPELVKHLVKTHDGAHMCAWIVAATWEDVCSGHDPDCA